MQIGKLVFVFLFSCRWRRAVEVRLIWVCPQSLVPNLKIYYNLNLLEPSGPAHACNGIALPLHDNQNRNMQSFANCSFTFSGMV